MRIKLPLGLLSILISILFFGSAHAKPSYVGMDCSLCHIAPTVTNFQLPSSHDSLTVPITSFTATDTDNQKANLAGVTGYLVSTSPTTPGVEDPGWQSAAPSQFTFTAEGSQTLYAWAKDAVGDISEAASGVVNISIFVNTPPVADAGPDQSVAEGVTVTLNGANSDDSDNGIKSFLWEQVGTDNPVTLSDPNAETPTFVTPDVGMGGVVLTFRLTVTDYSDAIATDTCIVNVSWVNIAPVADAGADQTVPEGTKVTLNGNASSGVDDAIDNYLWEQVNVTGAQAVLSDPTNANPEFTLSDVGPGGESMTFQLTVTDQGGLQATDRCVVNVTNVNQPPVADAGGDQSVLTGAEVTLDASGSFDPDGDTLSYTWKQNQGTPVTLTAAGATNPVFTAPAVAAGSSETLVFELMVTDGGQLQATSTCNVQVNGEELPPVVEPPVEEPPVVEPPAEEPPVIEPPAEEPPVIEPPAEEPPVIEPPAEEPPVIEPPVVEPPVIEPPVIEPPLEEPPTECTEVTNDVAEMYKHLSKTYATRAKVFKNKSEKLKKASEKVKPYDAERAQIYKTKAQALKQKSKKAKQQSRTYKEKYKKAKKCLEDDDHEDDDHEDDDHEDDEQDDHD